MQYRGQAVLPYLFMLIATLAMLEVPRLVANVLNAVTNGSVAKLVLDGLGKIPPAFISQALPAILKYLSYPLTWSKDQLVAKLTLTKTNAPHDLIVAGIALVAWGWFGLGGTTGTIVAIVGLVPLIAGLFDFCVFAPLFGAPLSGPKIRAGK